MLSGKHRRLYAQGSARTKAAADAIACAVVVAKIATGVAEENLEEPTTAAELGRRGGKARALKMSPERRSEIARAAAKARYDKP